MRESFLSYLLNVFSRTNALHLERDKAYLVERVKSINAKLIYITLYLKDSGFSLVTRVGISV